MNEWEEMSGPPTPEIVTQNKIYIYIYITSSVCASPRIPNCFSARFFSVSRLFCDIHLGIPETSQAQQRDLYTTPLHELRSTATEATIIWEQLSSASL